MESLFVVQNPSNVEERTFWREDKLPSLPVPSLNETLGKYLDSCKAVLSLQEYQKTEAIVQRFRENEGPLLHKLLLEKAKEKKNWLEDWWLNGYLDYRGPLGMSNFGGTSNFNFWPAESGSQLKRLSMMLHLHMKFWLLLREEKIAQIKDREGNTFSMHQFRYMFNNCRVPGKHRDELRCRFKTIFEGYCPSHAIIIYQKRLYKVDVMSTSTGEILSPRQWYNVLTLIKRNEETGPGVANLTELSRGTWTEARAHLMALSQENEKNIQDIESAIFCYALFDDDVKDNSELMTLAVSGSYGNRWADKLNYICTANGRFGCHTDHTPSEGISFVFALLYNEVVLRETYNNGKWDPSWSEELPVESLKELTFITDERIDELIIHGRKIAENFHVNSKFVLFTYSKFGKSELKKLKVHPCAFNEICILLAYMRKHGKPVPTYETATTRAFYHGRTETIRSCTPEAVAFCEALLHDASNQKELFKKACDKYMWLMEECKAGKGCDRHLLGLAAIAQENGIKLPEIFTDQSFKKTGGDGNFILSTSCSGYESADGSTIPMREDGYGVFFRINDYNMHYAITTVNNAPGISAESMADYLSHALTDVYNLLREPSKL